MAKFTAHATYWLNTWFHAEPDNPHVMQKSSVFPGREHQLSSMDPSKLLIPQSPFCICLGSTTLCGVIKDISSSCRKPLLAWTGNLLIEFCGTQNIVPHWKKSHNSKCIDCGQTKTFAYLHQCPNFNLAPSFSKSLLSSLCQGWKPKIPNLKYNIGCQSIFF